MDNQNNDNMSHEHNHDHSHDHNHDHSDHQHHDNSTLMGVLSYLGPLVIIPLLAAKNNPFVKFHTKQGLILLSINILLWVVTPMFFWHMWPLVRLVNLALFVLTIIGIVNVVQKKQNMLPVVGSLARYFKF